MRAMLRGAAGHPFVCAQVPTCVNPHAAVHPRPTGSGGRVRAVPPPQLLAALLLVHMCPPALTHALLTHAPQAQVDESELSPSELLAARLPHFGDMLARLMGAGSFRVGDVEGGNGVVRWGQATKGVTGTGSFRVGRRNAAAQGIAWGKAARGWGPGETALVVWAQGTKQAHGCGEQLQKRASWGQAAGRMGTREKGGRRGLPFQGGRRHGLA